MLATAVILLAISLPLTSLSAVMLSCLKRQASPLSRHEVCDAVLKTKKSRLPGAASLLGALSTPLKCPVVPTPSRSAFAPISSSRVGAAQSSTANSAVRSFRSLFRPEHSLSGTPTGTMSSEEGVYCKANAMTVSCFSFLLSSHKKAERSCLKN